MIQSGGVARSDVRPPGMRTVAGSNPVAVVVTLDYHAGVRGSNPVATNFFCSFFQYVTYFFLSSQPSSFTVLIKFH